MDNTVKLSQELERSIAHFRNKFNAVSVRTSYGEAGEHIIEVHCPLKDILANFPSWDCKVTDFASASYPRQIEVRKGSVRFFSLIPREVADSFRLPPDTCCC